MADYTDDMERRSKSASKTKKRRGGWEGEEMELKHARETWKEKKSENTVAVDLEQFRNHKVGEGYQAKFVVRQKRIENAQPIRRDVFSSKEAISKQTETHDKKKRKRQRQGDAQELLNGYLQCEGLRHFRKEIENMLNSP